MDILFRNLEKKCRSIRLMITLLFSYFETERSWVDVWTQWWSLPVSVEPVFHSIILERHLRNISAHDVRFCCLFSLACGDGTDLQNAARSQFAACVPLQDHTDNLAPFCCSTCTPTTEFCCRFARSLEASASLSERCAEIMAQEKMAQEKMAWKKWHRKKWHRKKWHKMRNGKNGTQKRKKWHKKWKKWHTTWTKMAQTQL